MAKKPKKTDGDCRMTYKVLVKSRLPASMRAQLDAQGRLKVRP